MRHYRMDNPDAQAVALAVRVGKELRSVLAAPPETGWERNDDPPRRGLAKHFRLEYPVSHRLWATMRFIDGQRAELHLFVDGENALPAGLELFATLRWAPQEPFGMTAFQAGFEGDAEDVDRLNADATLLGLVREVLRTEWERGDLGVERPDALLEVVPEPAIVHASTLPRNAWLGLVQDFGLLSFVRAADRIQVLQQGDG